MIALTTDAAGSRSHQRSTRRTPVLPPEAIRTIPFGTALILLGTARPIIATLGPWTARHDHVALAAHRDAHQHTLHRGHA